jgi:hypothetical protein
MRPAMVAENWWFHWSDVPVHTAAVVLNYIVAKQFQVIQHYIFAIWCRPTFSSSP